MWQDSAWKGEEKSDPCLRKATYRDTGWARSRAHDQQASSLRKHISGEQGPSLQNPPLEIPPNPHLSRCWLLPSRRQPWNRPSHPAPPPRALLGFAGWGFMPLFAKPPWWIASRMAAESVVFISAMSQPSPLNHCSCWQPLVRSWQPGLGLAAPSVGLPAGKACRVYSGRCWRRLLCPFLTCLSLC